MPSRLRVYLEPRDAWVGVYNAPGAVYVCLLPFVVIRWMKRGKLDVIDPYDEESLSATDYALLDARIADLAGRVECLEELAEFLPPRHYHQEEMPYGQGGSW